MPNEPCLVIDGRPPRAIGVFPGLGLGFIWDLVFGIFFTIAALTASAAAAAECHFECELCSARARLPSKLPVPQA